MSASAYTETPFSATVETTQATPTTLITFTVPDKTADCYDFEVFACRDFAAGPVAGYWKMNSLARINPSGGLAQLPTAAGSINPATGTSQISDATLAVAFNASGTSVSVIVQGLASTTLWWFVNGKRKQLASTT